MLKKHYSDFSDDDLLKFIRQDDREAFAELYRRYWDHLLDAACRRLRTVEQAEELVQDIFVSFFMKRKEIEITTSVKAYLNSAVKYRIFNEVRAEIVRNRYQELALAEKAYAADANDLLNAKELQSEINRRLSLLPDKCREAFLLSRQNNLSHKRIAEQLGISVSTVEKHIGKALKTLRKDLREYQLDILIVTGTFVFSIIFPSL